MLFGLALGAGTWNILLTRSSHQGRMAHPGRNLQNRSKAALHLHPHTDDAHLRIGLSVRHLPYQPILNKPSLLTLVPFNSEARELIAELEFVWDQIKSQPPSSGSPSSSNHRPPDPLSHHNAAGLRVLPPQSSSAESSHHVGPHEPDDWKGRVEATLSRLTAEVAALREELQTPSASSLFTSRVRWRRRTVVGWIAHFLWEGAKHLAVDVLLLALVLAWLRRKGDRRLEEKLRSRLGWWSQWARRRAGSVRR